MKAKILNALADEISEATELKDSSDPWDNGYLRGLRRAKFVVNRLMEREERAREAPVTGQNVDQVTADDTNSLDYDTLMKLPDGMVGYFSALTDKPSRRLIVPFSTTEAALRCADKYHGTVSAIKCAHEVCGYAAIIPFEEKP